MVQLRGEGDKTLVSLKAVPLQSQIRSDQKLRSLLSGGLGGHRTITLCNGGPGLMY